MFISEQALWWSIDQLKEGTHTFLGITFLACKRFGLPVGSPVETSLDSITRDHLELHHRLDPKSEFFFQPFKSTQFWLNPRYPSSGLQAVNTQTFAGAFLHEKGSKTWAFSDRYLDEIAKKFEGDSNVNRFTSLSAMAIWLGKSHSWNSGTSIRDVVDSFAAEYRLSDRELEMLFSREPTLDEKVDSFLLQSEPCDTTRVSRRYAIPPDSSDDAQGTLHSLKLSGIGPADQFEIEFGKRLSVVVGDNGLGKSFLLDAAWRALTGSWSGDAIWFDNSKNKANASLTFSVQDQFGQMSEHQIAYSMDEQRWESENAPAPLPVLCIYAKADGSFTVSDKARLAHASGTPAVDFFSVEEVWHGKHKRIEGLIRDWVSWESGEVSDEFLSLMHVLRHLAPEDIGRLDPGPLARLPDDVRDIPTVKTAYGTTPITLLSAGVRRALQLAYIVIWTWHEHKRAAACTGQHECGRLVLIVDEIEAHLHPKWQRIVLPALIGVGKLLSEELEVQVIAATHSPIVMASLETEFDATSDALYHLDLRAGEVRLSSMEFFKYGDISAWLTSPVFGLGYARSREAEKAIIEAKRIQLTDEPVLDEIKQVHKELKRVLGGDDVFWARWLYFAKHNGLSE